MVRAMYKECHVEGDQDEASEGPDPIVAFILSPSEQLTCMPKSTKFSPTTGH